jgi:periplasmic protein TonB
VTTLNPGAQEKCLSPINLIGLGISVTLHFGVLFLVMLPKNPPLVLTPDRVYNDTQIFQVPLPRPKPPKPQKTQPQKQENRSGSAPRDTFQTRSSKSTLVAKSTKGNRDGDKFSGKGKGPGSEPGLGIGPGNPIATEVTPSTPSTPLPPAELIKAKPLSPPIAVYPDAARSEGREGTVIIRAFISETGEVIRTKVMQSSQHADLDEAAQAAVSRIRFEPAHRGDTNEASKVDIPVRFSLS